MNYEEALRNENRRRWYGLRPGDKVRYRTFSSSGGWEHATVERLHLMDNNGCSLKDEEGREFDYVCEWCEVVEKVEDIP